MLIEQVREGAWWLAAMVVLLVIVVFRVELSLGDGEE